MTKYLFFKGCTIPAKLPNVEKLALDILPEIGIELQEEEQFSCCPDPVQLEGANHYFWLAVAARNLAIAEEKGMDIMTLCNGCLNTLAVTNAKLQKSAELKAAVNNVLKEIGKEYKGTVKVKHLMQVIKEDIGYENLKSKVKKPLHGLKVASHPGCHLLMPDEVLKYDDPTDPQEYDKFVSALGATAVDYITKVDCCGVSLNLVGDKEANNKCIANKLLDIKNHTGAHILSTGCPFCFTQFDMGQIMASRDYPELKDSKIPVIYAVELLGLAMGKSLDEIGYKTHRIKPEIKVWEVM
ncbi:MAG: CoB--CoM heterodisulfide reductase iron-sulfur subunit B family protein [Candidatus Lokiarchaeota archaeon]|nr:CoB--CoM heterodisulfide reductase iron-sulfur subunit B family protein [Candidatus Lokiarchaeota archaeon]